MKKFIAFFVILFGASDIFSQAFDYSKVTGNAGPNNGNIRLGSDGNIYKIGTFSGSLSLSNNISINSTTPQNYLVKYDACGNYIIHAQNIELYTDWCVDDAGDIYLIHYSGSSLGTRLVTINKYSSSLSFVWKKIIPQVILTGNVKIIPSKAAGGGVIITGSAIQDIGNLRPVLPGQPASTNQNSAYNTVSWRGIESAFMLKLDVNGNYIHHSFLGMAPQLSNEYSYIVSITSFKKSATAYIYQGGWFQGMLNFLYPSPFSSCDPPNPNGCGQYATYICKYTDNPGFLINTIWRYKVTWPATAINSRTAPIVAESNSNCVFAIPYTGNWWPNDVTNPNSALLTSQQRDIVVSCIGATGNFLWTRQIGSTGNEELIDMKTDDNGNAYILGKFSNTVVFAPGTGNTLTASATSNYFLLKLDAAGNFIWVKQLNMDGSYYKCYPTADGNTVYVDGNFQNTVDFDPGPLTANSKTSAGNYDDVFVRFGNARCVSDSCLCSKVIIEGTVKCVRKDPVTNKWIYSFDGIVYNPCCTLSSFSVTTTLGPVLSITPSILNPGNNIVHFEFKRTPVGPGPPPPPYGFLRFTVSIANSPCLKSVYIALPDCQ